MIKASGFRTWKRKMNGGGGFWGWKHSTTNSSLPHLVFDLSSISALFGQFEKSLTKTCERHVDEVSGVHSRYSSFIYSFWCHSSDRNRDCQPDGNTQSKFWQSLIIANRKPADRLPLPLFRFLHLEKAFSRWLFNIGNRARIGQAMINGQIKKKR